MGLVVKSLPAMKETQTMRTVFVFQGIGAPPQAHNVSRDLQEQLDRQTPNDRNLKTQTRSIQGLKDGVQV